MMRGMTNNIYTLIGLATKSAIPLLIASGAESRKVLGTTVCFGLLVATGVSLVAVPMIWFIIQFISDRFAKVSD